jgi:uncharacterized protein (DUF1810 family)
MAVTTTRTPQIVGLARFHAAQRRTYPQALREIQRGEKVTHWMWFIFPQHRGLAKSDMAHRFGIADRDEAVAYLDNAILRTRLFECSMGVLRQRKLMFGGTDTRKLRACMTLFREVADDKALPGKVLDKFFDGEPDQLTLDLLAGKKIELPEWEPCAPSARRWEQGALRVPADTSAWTRERVTSFVRSFGLSSVATRQMVDAWMADRGRAMGAVWAAREESAWRDRR